MTYHNYRTSDYSSNKPDFILEDKLIHESLSYPAFMYTLFYIFSVYLVIPVFEVPFLGLSLSAPLFFFIAVPCVFKPSQPWFRTYSRWITLAILFWVGIFISTMGNGILSYGTEIGLEGIITLVQYIYWLIVFVITAYFANQEIVIKKLTKILGWAVLALAFLRWFEGIVFGRIGAWTGTEYFSQNSYGSLFSIFSPYLLIMIIQGKGWKRLLAIIGNFILWGALLINGSRGSWVAIALGILATLLMLFVSKPRKFAGLFSAMMVVILGLILIWNFFPQIVTPVQERMDTFRSLEEDKSYEFRKLMLQKGIIIFKQNPLIGVGAGRFKKTTVGLKLTGPFAGRGSADYFTTQSAHNSYIVVLAEYGLAGVLPFGILLLSIAIGGFRSTLGFLRDGKLYYLPIFISLVQMSTHFWVVASLTNTVTWFVYGLCAAVIMLYKKKTKN